MKWQSEMEYYKYNYRATDKKDSILFKGFEFSHPKSEVTGEERLKYHQDRPYEKYVPYYKTYQAGDSLLVPDVYIVGGQCKDVIENLRANGVGMMIAGQTVQKKGASKRITFFEANKRPYEGHFVYSKVEDELVERAINVKPGDVIIPTDQKYKRFIVSVLEPETPDSYFRWNYFDSYVQQKEYFSPYVFEDKAKSILENDLELKSTFENKKATDKEFNESTWNQLYFIYKHSEYFEPSFNILPIHSLFD